MQGMEGAIHYCLPSGKGPITQLHEKGGRLLGVLADGGIVAWNSQT